MPEHIQGYAEKMQQEWSEEDELRDGMSNQVMYGLGEHC